MALRICASLHRRLKSLLEEAAADAGIPTDDITSVFVSAVKMLRGPGGNEVRFALGKQVLNEELGMEARIQAKRKNPSGVAVRPGR